MKKDTFKSYKRLRLLEMACNGKPRPGLFYKPQIDWAMRNGFIDEHFAITPAGVIELDRYKPKYPTNHFGLLT